MHVLSLHCMLLLDQLELYQQALFAFSACNMPLSVQLVHSSTKMLSRASSLSSTICFAGAALVASVAAVYILVPCLKPSAKRLLASVSNAVAVGTMRVKPSLWLCLESLQVRPCIVLLYYIPRGIPSAVLACWVLGF